MATRNKTRYAILGLLNIKECSGYDIKKFCDKTISYFWNENFGHIYPVLGQLQKESLIEQIDIENNERRKIYKITEKGKSEFYDWMVQPLEFQPPRSELLLKLSFGIYIPKEKVIEMMQEVKIRNISQLQKYKEIEKSYINDEKARQHPQYVYWLAPLRYGILACEAVISWCDETILSINNQ